MGTQDINNWNDEDTAGIVNVAMQEAGMEKIEFLMQAASQHSITLLAATLRDTEWYNFRRREDTDFDVAAANEGASQEQMDKWIASEWLFDMSFHYTMSGTVPSPNDDNIWD